MTKTQRIQAIYDAFGRGDVPTILTHLADDVDWNNSRVVSKECPWNGDFSGKTHVPNFFRAVGDNMDFSEFTPQTFTESTDHVAVLLHFACTLKKNGQPFVNDAVHFWGFNDRGQVNFYRHFNDTGAELAAWRN